MMTKNPYPILEFDDNKTAKLNPSVFVSRPFDTDKMVITFFPEVVDALIAEEKNQARPHHRWRKSRLCIPFYRHRCFDHTWCYRLPCLRRKLRSVSRNGYYKGNVLRRWRCFG